MKELLKNTEEKMNKTVAVLERDYKSIRAGRANVSVLDRVTVDYYGCPTPIQQMAAVSVPEPRILMIQPWDATTLKDIEKAILTSDIGINPFPSPRLQRNVARILLRRCAKRLRKTRWQYATPAATRLKS